jgi:nitroimidazol reductase NimA-like FMN-containing flavoprotein (pyridoxamine 5'-phosphate oxidase superfamily)
MSYHIRRKDKEITNTTVLKKILRSTKYITIALSMNNQPYLVTLSHGYDEKQNCIYFHCAAEGKKLDYLNSNSTLWGQAILDYGYSEGNCTHLYASVHFSGKVELINKLEGNIRQWNA